MSSPAGKLAACPICKEAFQPTIEQATRMRKGVKVTCGRPSCVSKVKSDAAKNGKRKATPKVNVIPVIKMHCPWATGQIKNGNRIEMNPL